MPERYWRADVVALAHALGRIVALEEDLEELLVAHALRVEDDEHGLVVTGAAGAHLFIGRVWGEPAGVADRGHDHTGDVPEPLLGTPEAAEPEQGLLGSFRIRPLQRRPIDEMVRGRRNGGRTSG